MALPGGQGKGLVPPKSHIVSQCKGCKEPIRINQDRIWSTRPMGLVHLTCALVHKMPTSGEPTTGTRK